MWSQVMCAGEAIWPSFTTSKRCHDIDWIDRQTNRQTARQTDRQTNKRKDNLISYLRRWSDSSPSKRCQMCSFAYENLIHFASELSSGNVRRWSDSTPSKRCQMFPLPCHSRAIIQAGSTTRKWIQAMHRAPYTPREGATLPKDKKEAEN